MLDTNTVQLCCRGKGCPVVTKIDEDTYEVTDDNGNKIRISGAELKLMSDAANRFEGEQQLICG